MTIEDGGPAFPVLMDFCPTKGIRSMEGMSVRDVFAKAALPTCLAKTIEEYRFDGIQENKECACRAADWAYLVADAMLAVRAIEPDDAE